MKSTCGVDNGFAVTSRRKGRHRWIFVRGRDLTDSAETCCVVVGYQKKRSIESSRGPLVFCGWKMRSLFDAIERRQVQASEVREGSQFIAQQQDGGRANLSLGLPLCVTIYIP